MEVLGLAIGWIITFVIIGVFTLLTLLFGFIAWRMKTNTSYDVFGKFHEGWSVGILISASVVIGTTLIAALLAIPYEAKYMQLHGVTTEVVEVSNSFDTGSGNSTQTDFVVTLEGVDRPVVFDDPRISQFVGETIDARCHIKWVYSGADQYLCFIG